MIFSEAEIIVFKRTFSPAIHYIPY